MNGIIAVLVESGTQLRIHRVRVLLSLIGVAVAVMALTASVALSQIVRTISIEAMEQSSGRPATLTVSVYPNTGTIDNADLLVAANDIAERYQIDYMSPALWTGGTLTMQGMTIDTQALGVGPQYAEMHRIAVDEGRWLSEGDADRLAPAIVVSKSLFEQLGYSSVAQHPTVQMPDGRTALIVGVVDGGQFSNYPWIIGAPETVGTFFGAEGQFASSPTFEFWISSADAEVATEMITRDFRGAFPGAEVSVNRADWEFYLSGGDDPYAIMQAILLGISGVVLLLGALSLINIAVVTVRQRVREFGIRRAFGASLSRVYVGVMLESVVGTVIAGAVGIMIVAILSRLPFVAMAVSNGMVETLPFPVGAAVTGLVVSLVVGVIAGLVPATVAVRSKVIDAIRF